MRVVCIVQARLGSVRFPDKVLADLFGKPVIQHVIERARQTQGVDEVVATVPPEDEALRHVLRGLGLRIWPHDPPDVLAGYLRAARGAEAAIVMRVTGDCPVLDPVVAAKVLHLYRSESYLFRRALCDFASNDTLVSGYPDGTDVEIFSRSALETAASQATDVGDREHVTPWIHRNLRCVMLKYDYDLSSVKVSVDTPEDLERVKGLHSQLQGDLSVERLAAFYHISQR
jgi:spore coat polysaccharide biosynthesis protein SpsF (cytidylyltransferase family)